MCGIAGQLSWVQPPNRGAVEAMTAGLRHRGPDAQAVQEFGPIALGHARLSILDLSVAANQPMLDGDGVCAIVFNGEIYNFGELRRELEARGARFRTSGDTEVLLEAYKAWGTGCLARLNGMFAFALWDFRRQTLLLARDRFGKKPLYYFRTPDGGVAFASELKALRRHPQCPRTLDDGAIRQYLALNYTLSARCILHGVNKLSPAYWLELSQGVADRMECYWNYADAFRRKSRFRSEAEAVEALDTLLADAVRLRMISDVPLGAFLSGGIDSSTITAHMVNQSSSPVRTFSIAFREASYDESAFARQVATHMGLDHRDKMVADDPTTALDRLAFAADEPFADTSFLPTMALCAFARQHVTVCLSGDGGDELFGGYDTYVADRLFQGASHLPRSLVSLARQGVDRYWPASFAKVGTDEKIRRFLAGLGNGFERAHYSWRSIFNDDDLSKMLSDDRVTDLVEADPALDFSVFFNEVSDLHYLDRAMYVDAKTWLVDDVLVKVDRAAMTHALEVRAPLLDYRVAEFAAGLPVDWKVRGFAKKYLLGREHARFFPKPLRPRKKRGFNAPVSHWLTSGFQDMCREATRHPLFSDWFRPGVIDQLWVEHLEGKRDHGLKLFGLTCLGLWLAADVESETPVSRNLTEITAVG